MSQGREILMMNEPVANIRDTSPPTSELSMGKMNPRAVGWNKRYASLHYIIFNCCGEKKKVPFDRINLQVRGIVRLLCACTRFMVHVSEVASGFCSLES